MTPEIKILRDALKDAKARILHLHEVTGYNVLGPVEFIDIAIKQADEVKKDFSVDMSGAKMDSEKRTISGIKIRWAP